MLEFPALVDLSQHLRELVNKDYQVFVFEGTRCHITKGVFKYLKLPDQTAVPLFAAPSLRDLEIDETGILSEHNPEDVEYPGQPTRRIERAEPPSAGWPYEEPAMHSYPDEFDNFGDVATSEPPMPISWDDLDGEEEPNIERQDPLAEMDEQEPDGDDSDGEEE